MSWDFGKETSKLTEKGKEEWRLATEGKITSEVIMAVRDTCGLPVAPIIYNLPTENFIKYVSVYPLNRQIK